MSMDGRFLFYLCQELDELLANGRIQKIYQLSRTDFLFVVRTPGKTRQLYMSLSTSVTRIHLSELSYDKPDNPSGFCMLLRKYVEGGLIERIETVSGDRIIRISILSHDEIGDESRYYLFMEIMGRYANLIVVENDSRIIDAFVHISPFEDKTRTIEKGAAYLPPVDQKIDPEDQVAVVSFFQANQDFTARDIVDGFRGISPLLANHFLSLSKETKAEPAEVFQQVVHEPVNPTLATIKAKKYFYFYDLFATEDKSHFPTLSELLEEYFHDAGRMERNRQITRNLVQMVRRELEKSRNKLEKLSADLSSAIQSDIYRIKGDLIIQFQSDIFKGQSNYKAFSYELNQEVEIALDPLLTPIRNAAQYYRKYKKYRSSIPYIKEQMELSKINIEYFSLISVQIETASQTDLDEIQQELASLGYIRRRSPFKKKRLPNFDTYLTPEMVEIIVGKNNTQNEYITHHLAKPGDWWFHTQGHHGSHVICRAEKELDEPTLRSAANLAAFFSEARHSSSVPVDYTKVKFVKKVSGQPGSFVTYTNQKTIYIDPDISLVEALHRKRK